MSRWWPDCTGSPSSSPRPRPRVWWGGRWQKEAGPSAAAAASSPVLMRARGGSCSSGGCPSSHLLQLLPPITALSLYRWAVTLNLSSLPEEQGFDREDGILTEEVLESCLGWNSGPLLTRCVRLYLTDLLWGFSELIHIKCLSQGLEYTKYSVTLLPFWNY